MASPPFLHTFTYDRFQQEAIDALDTDASLLVAAPTGAGKTVIADHVISRSRERGEIVIYTAPVKALSNQKYREFSAQYGDEVGILTGDVAINPDAPIRIMTTEIYRNTLLDQPEGIQNAAWVIFDEVHYIDDIERGTVWEEAIMLTPASTRLLCLSATVPNVDEIAQWMSTVLGREVTVVTETHRPVPLHFLYQCNGSLHNTWKKLKQNGYGSFLAHKAKEKQRKNRRKKSRCGRRYERDEKKTYQPAPIRLSQLMDSIVNASRLPCIYFAFSRRRTEQLAREVLEMDLPILDHGTQLDAHYHALCERYGVTEEPSAIALKDCIHRGVAYHHAGMLPTLKEIVEQMFTAKLLSIVFTTETFALGINMPARTVVFDEVRKFYGTGFDVLRPRDFYQMAGRAGRRGMDDEGFVYIRVIPTYVKLEELHTVIFGKQKPVYSQFNASYATLMNLYMQHGEDVISIYPYTLHAFQASKRRRQRALKRFERRLDLLKADGYIADGELTEKGIFASWLFGYELMCAQLRENNVLETLSAQELCIALGSLVCEKKRGFMRPPRPPQHIRGVLKEVDYAFRHVHQSEIRHGIKPYTERPYHDIALALDCWISGGSFAETVELSGRDEGSIVRYFRMVIQLLRQIGSAPNVTPELQKVARQGRILMDRGVVDAEKQLRA